VRRLLLVCLLIACPFATGCGGGGERGKNKDYDRPSSQKRAEK
jgi:hypothetical protein